MQVSVYLLLLEGNEALLQTHIIWQFLLHILLLQPQMISQVRFAVPITFSFKRYPSLNIK